jgi:sortase A
MGELKEKSKSKIGLALGLIGLGLLLVFGSQNTPLNGKIDSFENEPVSIQGFLASDYDETKIPKRILIPELSIDLEVEKAEIVGGYWKVFPDKAGWGGGSGLPGEPGNQVIFAHAQEGLFLPLKNVEEAMKVYVINNPDDEDDNENVYEYQVVGIKEVFPNQLEVIEPTEDETLTLYTCSGFNDSNRLIVTAKRI